MKKRVSRMISAALALALCLGMSLIPASAAETEANVLGTVAVEGVEFTITGESLEAGSELTVGTADLGEGDLWSLNIHFTQSGSADHYAAVTPEGEMTELFTANQVNDYYEYLTIPSEETRTFTLTIPEEYADWNVAIRFGYNNSFGELPLEEREDVSFTDVAEGDWFAPFVIPAANAGWFSGNPDGSFGPNQSLTVAQVVVLAARLRDRIAAIKKIADTQTVLLGEDRQMDVVGFAQNGTLACGIVMKTNAILLAIIIGISQGSQPIIGFNFGAKKYDRVKKTFLLGSVVCTIITVLSSASYKDIRHRISFV